MLDKDGAEQLREQIEVENKELWRELVIWWHEFKTRKGNEVHFWFLIEDPAKLSIIAKIYFANVKSVAEKYRGSTEFYMGVYQHHDGKELFWGQIDCDDILKGKLNEDFGHDPTESPLPDPEDDVFETVPRW